MAKRTTTQADIDRLVRILSVDPRIVTISIKYGSALRPKSYFATAKLIHNTQFTISHNKLTGLSELVEDSIQGWYYKAVSKDRTLRGEYATV